VKNFIQFVKTTAIGGLVVIIPLATIGQVHILPESRVTVMELSMVETIGCLSQMGLEACKLYSGGVQQA